MLAQTHSANVHGADGRAVFIECDMTKSLPGLTIVGLGSKTVDEAKERLRGAIRNSDLDMPAQRIIINLAPADIPKDSTCLDLGMAVAILAASRQLDRIKSADYLYLGELALDGSLRPVKGLLALLQAARSTPVKTVIVPSANAVEAALLAGKVKILTASSLKDVYRHLVGIDTLRALSPGTIEGGSDQSDQVDLAEITGQEHAKRALEIAAAGHHNLLLTGPPGTGKTMLARALVGILPKPSHDEMVEITMLHSLIRGGSAAQAAHRPFRNPHHTASVVAIIGGGQHPRPGEISLAHRGVLFLDELPEYPRHILESLRQPLEDKVIRVARSNDTLTYPASFMLVATKNPCPCGHYGNPEKACICSAAQINNYQKRISGPLLDRLDMIVEVGKVDQKLAGGGGPTSKEVGSRVEQARQVQRQRYRSDKTNAELTNREINKYCQLDEAAGQLLAQATDKLSLSMRSVKKVIRVARTIADLNQETNVSTSHLAEALQYRQRADGVVMI